MDQVLPNMTVNQSIHLRPDEYYKYIDQENITGTWFLVNTPVPVLSVIAVYLVFVLGVGPRFMKSRNPYELRPLMMIYNLVQVMYNIWMLHEVFSRPYVITILIKHNCYPMDPRTNFGLRLLLHQLSWHYLTSKIIDLLDTCIMVLRKKQSHITYLHLYHHVAMVFFTWFSIRYVTAQQGSFPMLLNSFVHVVMYSYYFLACFGPQVQKYLWWKRHLTKLQLTQFALVILFLGHLYLNKCEVSQAFNMIWIVNVSVIAAFFINFYIQTYIVKPRKHHVKSK